MFLDGYAPFSSMTTRETFLDVGDSVMAAPGPGQYDPGIIGERVKGGHTLANRVSILIELLSFLWIRVQTEHSFLLQCK